MSCCQHLNPTHVREKKQISSPSTLLILVSIFSVYRKKNVSLVFQFIFLKAFSFSFFFQFITAVKESRFIGCMLIFTILEDNFVIGSNAGREDHFHIHLIKQDYVQSQGLLCHNIYIYYEMDKVQQLF